MSNQNESTIGSITLIGGRGRIVYKKKFSTDVNTSTIQCNISPPVDWTNTITVDPENVNSGSESFTITSKLVGTNVVFSIVSDNPNSTTSANYMITESSDVVENYKITSSIDGADIVYDVESLDDTDESIIPFIIFERLASK